MLKYNPEVRVQRILHGQALSLPPPQKSLGVAAIPFLRERAFLGQPQPYNQRTSSGRLSTQQIEDVRSLGIVCYETTYYHRGLVNAATKTGESLKLQQLHTYVANKLALIRAHPSTELSSDVQALLRGLELCVRGQIALMHQANGLLQALQREQQLQLAQLGCLLLPPTLISILQEPVHFVDTTSVAIGRLGEVVLHLGESSCLELTTFTTSKKQKSLGMLDTF